MKVRDLATPALLVDAEVLAANLAAMAAALPGPRLRPHVKAHKCTQLAAAQAGAGHRSFTAATVREVIGLAHAGLRDDILLANEVVDVDRLRAAVATGARLTVAVDSTATVDAAAAAGVGEVVIDVDVGLPRCGCPPADAGRVADHARSRHLAVRGVMGYEGHVVGLADRAAREEQTATAMATLVEAHARVGGDLVTAGGTGTYDINTWATEIQAGSYALMDTAYGQLDLPFRPALAVVATVISVNPGGWAVADCGLKALGMDHGNPSLGDAGDVWYCSDEHLTWSAPPGAPAPAVGDRVRVWPAHVDPTVAYHERFHIVAGDEVVDSWPIDLRGW